MNDIEVYWLDQYKEKRALWLHDGNPKRPHAELTWGRHSAGFFNSELVMEDPLLLDEASRGLVRRLISNGVHAEDVDRVVGPAMGAITLAHDIARCISRYRSLPCLRAYAEKGYVNNLEAMVFKKTTVLPNEVVLLVEDVITTGGSVDLIVDAVANAGGSTLPFVLTLVNRSGLTEVSGRKIIALIDHPMPMWLPNECPLCSEGSEAIRPKGEEDWARLNAAY